jgi:hypothetical protein
MEEPHSTPRRDWPLLVLLLLLALAMRVWQVTTCEVAARDSVTYVRIAWLLEHGDWRQVIPKSPHHPAYPLTILAVSSVVRQLDPGLLPDRMQLSAQIASSIASVLLVLPLFFLGRALFDRRVAFWATLMFQCVPASGRVLGDGLSESLFLLLATTALWLSVIAFQRRSPWCFAGVGLFGALAYLTRPEGALIIAATGIILAALQLRRGTRRPWGHFAASALSMSVAALILAAPFMILIRGVTTKNTAIKIFQSAPATSDDHRARPPAMSSLAKQPVVFAVFSGEPGTGDASQRRLWALMILVIMFGKLAYYIGWVPLLIGLWVYRDKFRLLAGSWVLALVSLAVLPLLYLVALKMGYLSERHVLLVLCFGIYWTVAAVLWLAEWCAAWFPGRRWISPTISATLLGLTCIAGLARTLEPMHSDRAGFREAGYWLAEHAQPEEDIDDPYGWASYYAGRAFVERPPVHVPGTPHCVYVVIESSNNKHPDLKPASNMEYVREHGAIVKRWPVRRRHETAEIELWWVTF